MDKTPSAVLKLLGYMKNIAGFKENDERSYYRGFAIVMSSAREAVGLTQSKLAEELGLSQKMISQIENEKQPPYAYTMYQIGSYLFYTVDKNDRWDQVEANVRQKLLEQPRS